MVQSQKYKTKLQSNFNHLLKWFSANKLSLNVSKTKSMLFCHARSPFRNFSLNIYGNGTPIEAVDTIKYLGLYLDRHLSFTTHIDHIIKKVSDRNRLLWKMRSFITESLAKYLYTTLIAPLFTYCDFIYDGTSETNKNRLQIIQNASLRAIKRTKLEYPVQRLHDELGIDLLNDTRKKSTLKMVYRGVNDLGPPVLNNMFCSYIPSKNLRSANLNKIQTAKTNLIFTGHDIAIRGSHYWNATDYETLNVDTLDQLKRRMKQYGKV